MSFKTLNVPLAKAQDINNSDIDFCAYNSGKLNKETT